MFWKLSLSCGSKIWTKHLYNLQWKWWWICIGTYEMVFVWVLVECADDTTLQQPICIFMNSSNGVGCSEIISHEIKNMWQLFESRFTYKRPLLASRHVYAYHFHHRGTKYKKILKREGEKKKWEQIFRKFIGWNFVWHAWFTYKSCAKKEHGHLYDYTFLKIRTWY